MLRSNKNIEDLAATRAEVVIRQPSTLIERMVAYSKRTTKSD